MNVFGVHGEPVGGGEATVALIALEVLQLLVRDQYIFAVKFSITVPTKAVSTRH